VIGAGRADCIGFIDTLRISGQNTVRLLVRQVTPGQTDDGDGYLIDNLTFTPIPEPSSTILLLGGALVLISFSLARKTLELPR
jgi:hypothetical protein